MWKIKSEQLGDRQIKYCLFDGDQSISFEVVLELWRRNEQFRDFFIELLSNLPFEAFRWETPPITKNTGDRPFEFVVSDSPGLSRRPDIKTFSPYLEAAPPDNIAEFANLGRDAWLIVPCQSDSPDKYVHLAVFIREAPIAQRHALLKHMGSSVQQRLGNQPIWLSTAGGGVAWLHVRLDSFPKYYRHTPYKTFEQI